MNTLYMRLTIFVFLIIISFPQTVIGYAESKTELQKYQEWEDAINEKAKGKNVYLNRWEHITKTCGKDIQLYLSGIESHRKVIEGYVEEIDEIYKVLRDWDDHPDLKTVNDLNLKAIEHFRLALIHTLGHNEQGKNEMIMSMQSLIVEMIHEMRRIYTQHNAPKKVIQFFDYMVARAQEEFDSMQDSSGVIVRDPAEYRSLKGALDEEGLIDDLMKL